MMMMMIIIIIIIVIIIITPYEDKIMLLSDSTSLPWGWRNF